MGDEFRDGRGTTCVSAGLTSLDRACGLTAPAPYAPYRADLPELLASHPSGLSVEVEPEEVEQYLPTVKMRSRMAGPGIIQTVTNWLDTVSRAEKRARDESYFIAPGADLCLCVRTEVSGTPARQEVDISEDITAEQAHKALTPSACDPKGG